MGRCSFFHFQVKRHVFDNLWLLPASMAKKICEMSFKHITFFKKCEKPITYKICHKIELDVCLTFNLQFSILAKAKKD